jgi:hypothetical protein
MVTGQTPDIAEYMDFGWYEMVWYLDQKAAFLTINESWLNGWELLAA